MQYTLSSICGREAGFIVGETNPLEFTFVSSQELLPPRLEYLGSSCRNWHWFSYPF
jgi:hypothetical protein